MSQKNIKELVEEAGVKLVPIGEGIYRGSSPFKISINHTPSFTVYSLTNSWFDFGMSMGGDAASFIAKLEGISYKAAKEKLEGDTEVLEIITQTLDGLAVKEEVDYSDELNMSVSKTCRDIIYRRPELVDKVMRFLCELDKVLQSSVSSVIMKEWIERSRELEK
jgi:hypothetical protein